MVAPSKSVNSLVTKKIGGTSIIEVLYNASKKIATVAAIYLLGYYNISVAWLFGPVILSVIREEWKKEKQLRRNIAKAAAMSCEKEVILARVDDLPSWVYFPDIERVEWLNRILRQVWPNVNDWARELLREIIEPRVRSALEGYKMYGFRFERMILGSIPLRIGGVKVYEHNVSRNEIILDADLFYAGDCNISFSIGGIKGGIKDFQIHGMARVVMKPLIAQMPLVGGLQIFFLNNPTIDFNLVGMADVLDMPGLSDILRRIIVEQIANIMVLPNKLPIKLSDAVPAETLKAPEPEGVLRIHLVEAKDLMKKDIGMLGKGKSDPYAIITVGAQEFRSQTINNTVNPKWDYWCECAVHDNLGQTLELQLYDADDLSKKDERLGRATIDISSVSTKGQIDQWIHLQQAKHGQVHIRLMWLYLTSESGDLPAALMETQQLRVTSMSSALLLVFIDSCKNLPNARAQSNPDPFIQLSLGKRQEISQVVMRNCDPVYEQGYTFLVNNPENDSLSIIVKDQKTGLELGQLLYHLASVLNKPGCTINHQPFTLNRSGPDSKIFMSLSLKILKLSEQEDENNETKEESTNDDVKSEEDMSEREQLLRQQSLRSQDSPAKSKTSSESSPLHRPPSRESMSSSTNTNTEELIKPITAPGALASSPPSSNGTSIGLGKIQITIRYSQHRQRLIVLVHKIENLPLNDPSNIPDPYVKLYLLPDRAKDSKRKTEVIKDNCNPVFDEAFEYLISKGEMNSKQLEVTVLTRKSWISGGSPVMGQVVVDLNQFDITKATTTWYELQPEIPRDS